MSTKKEEPKGRGRPPVDSERIDVRLPRDLLDKVDAVARAENVGRPEAVRRIIAKS
jgi:metal-responsive CopG/Arc/MetJ family transcriptional regulator